MDRVSWLGCEGGSVVAVGQQSARGGGVRSRDDAEVTCNPSSGFTESVAPPPKVLKGFLLPATPRTWPDSSKPTARMVCAVQRPPP